MINIEELAAQVKKEKTKIRLISSIGYLYPIVIVLTTLTIMTALVLFSISSGSLRAGAIKIFIFLGALTFYVVKAFFVKVKPDETKSVLSKKYSDLLKEHYRDLFKDIKTKDIIFTNDINASITQEPTGVFGGYNNQVRIGLPLLMLFSKEEVGSILLHELGHIKSEHGKAGHKEYLRYQRYACIYQALQDKAGILAKFYNWYFPFYERKSFSLRRLNEFEADAYAVKHSGAQTLGRTLFKLDGLSQFLTDFYLNTTWQQSKIQELPPENFFSEFINTRKENESIQAEVLNSISLRGYENDTESEYDTHPSTQSRLNAIGYQIEPWSISDKVAIEEIFTEQDRGEILNLLDRDWNQNNLQAWRDQFNYYQATRKKLEGYEQRDFDSLSKEEAIDYIENKAPHSNAVKIKPLYERVYAKFNWSIAAYNLAYIELESQNYNDSFKYFVQALNARPTLYRECHNDVLKLGLKLFKDEQQKVDQLMTQFQNNYNEVMSIGREDEVIKVEPGERTTSFFANYFGPKPEVKKVFIAKKAGKDEDEFVPIVGIEYSRYHDNVPMKEQKWEELVEFELTQGMPNLEFAIVIFFNDLNFKAKQWKNIANDENLVYSRPKKGFFSKK